MELWRLLAHNHWFTVNLCGLRVRLCARCSGYLIGFAAPFIFLGNLFGSVELTGVPGYVFLALAAPLVLDWVTQSWGYRESTNGVRLVTGILMGVDVFLFSKLSASLEMGGTIFVAAVITITVIGVLGKAYRCHAFPGIE